MFSCTLCNNAHNVCGFGNYNHHSIIMLLHEMDYGVRTDPSADSALCHGLRAITVPDGKNKVVWERGSVLWTVRWTVGSGVPKKAAGAPGKVFRGPHRPRICG